MSQDWTTPKFPMQIPTVGLRRINLELAFSTQAHHSPSRPVALGDFSQILELIFLSLTSDSLSLDGSKSFPSGKATHPSLLPIKTAILQFP
jgi:hypothetical protein